MSKNKSCSLCRSKNLIRYRNPLYIRDADICFYCYTVANNSFDIHISNNHSDYFIKDLINFSINKITNDSSKNILLFDNQNIDTTNFNTDIHIINNYNTDLSQYLKYGKIDIAIIPDINIYNLKNFLDKIYIYLSKNPSIVLGFYRENHYCNNLYNYNYIYNCYSIDRIASKYNLHVQKEFIYNDIDKYYIIELGLDEPSNYDIAELEKLTNDHIIEDYQKLNSLI